MPTVMFNFSDQAYATLQDLAREKGKTPGETLGAALGLLMYMREAERRHGRLITERDGRLYEVEVPA